MGSCSWEVIGINITCLSILKIKMKIKKKKKKSNGIIETELRLKLPAAIYTKIKCIAKRLIRATEITPPRDINKISAQILSPAIRTKLRNPGFLDRQESQATADWID